MHMAVVDSRGTDMPLRAFAPFTQELHELADWFKACGLISVAMESTGVYWNAVYEILGQRGFEVILVNARYAKTVPGRKTDVSDGAWLRQPHSCGLLHGSFRADAVIETLRANHRQREPLVEDAAAHIQHMQKALMEMNPQLHHVSESDAALLAAVGKSIKATAAATAVLAFMPSRAVKRFCRRFPAQCLLRSDIEDRCYSGYLIGRCRCSTWKVLPQQPVCVLVSVALPRALRDAEVDLDARVDLEAVVLSHFGP